MTDQPAYTDEAVLRNLRSIHIDIPDDAPPEEAAAFEDALADFVCLWMEDNPVRGPWDPFMYSHTEACEHSDHCYGPGSNAEWAIVARAKAEALREYATDLEANDSALGWEWDDFVVDAREYAESYRADEIEAGR